MHFYTKLFHKILDSSIWLEDEHTRLVWITLLAMKDENHHVICPPKMLAYKARVPEDACLKALEKFLAPDPQSTHHANDGRRLEKIEGGWLILNGQRYEELERTERRKAQLRIAQRNHRDRKKQTPAQQAGLAVGKSRPSAAERIATEPHDIAGGQL